MKILFFNMLLCFSLVAFAQREQNPESKTAGFKTSFARNKAGDNWFIHIGGGAQTILGDQNGKASFSDRITFLPTASAGKWFNPYWGVRLKGQGGSLHGFENNGAYMQHNRYYNVHLDAMWNLSNYWGAYSPNKVFNITPYAGLGYGHRFKIDKKVSVNSDGSFYRKSSDVLSANGGFQVGFRINDRINLDFDLGVAVVPDYFDRTIMGTQNDVIASLSGGFTFKLGKTTFETIVPYNEELINNLNNKINKLRIDNDVLSKRPEFCPECPIAAPVPTSAFMSEINYVPNVVFFRINSAKIEENQQVSVYNTAEFMKSSGEKIKVVGYADKETGSGKYNLTLSEKRAKAVAKELMTRYEIPSQKIVVEWKGASEQPYPENNWNRVVIMSVD
jgi:outer membrane protein OmpA-like peptidoglycan-associated protein